MPLIAFSRARLPIAALAPLLLAACTDPAGTSRSATPPEETAGSVELELRVSGAIRLSRVDYDVSRGTFHQTGSFAVGGSVTVSGVIGPLPAGTGYTVALHAVDDGQLLLGCDGSSAFDIVPGTTVSAPVHMTCHERPATRPAARDVPVPRSAIAALALLLAAFGAAAARGINRGSARRPAGGAGRPAGAPT